MEVDFADMVAITALEIGMPAVYEWVKENKGIIVGGTVTSVKVNALHDVTIVLDNGINIELFVKNGYHHYDDEQEQWVFFKHHDHSYPFITVCNKTVDIAVDW